MRQSFIALLLFSVLSGVSVCQQPVTFSANDLTDLRQTLEATARLLQQTRSELADSQQQIRQLRSEVETLKGGSAPAAAVANQPTTSSQSIDQLEESQNITDSRLEQIYQTKVESGSKYRVKLSGMLLFNASGNRGSVDDQDVPNLAQVTPPGQNGGNIGATFRQSFFRLGLTGPEAFGAKTSADVQFDFFGGFPNTLDGVALGIMRLQTAHASLAWDRWSVTVQQDEPFISPNSPTTLASMGDPGLGYSGNLWTWTPQIVAERRWELSPTVQATTQFGVMDPFDGEIPEEQFSRYPEAGELSRVPEIAARQALSGKVAGLPFRLGVGGLYSRQSYGFGRNVDSWAATGDWQVPLGNKFEISGEIFRGRALGGLWGGIGTSVVYGGPRNVNTTPIFGVNTIGGWAQLKYKPAEKWEINGAFGEDNPFTSDMRQFAVPNPSYVPTLRNWTTMVNVIQHPRSNLLLSLEYRHLNSVPLFGTRSSAEHINVGVGVMF